jgi:hypothetical protein
MFLISSKRWSQNSTTTLKASFMSKKTDIAIPDEVVISKIFIVREKKVMLDKGLADLYNVSNKGFKSGGKEKLITVP